MKALGILVTTVFTAVALLASGAEALLSLQVMTGRETALPCSINSGMVSDQVKDNAEVIPSFFGAQWGTRDSLLLAANEGRAREGETARGAIGRDAGVADREAAGDDNRMRGNDRDGFYREQYGSGLDYEADLYGDSFQDDAPGFRINRDKYYMDRDPYYMDRR